MTDFRWNEKTEEAAHLVADGALSDAEIASKLDVTRQTIWNWRQHPDFAARVEGYLADFRSETRRLGLANRDRRIRAINDRWNRLYSIIQARSEDPRMADAPGGKTGLMVGEVKGVGRGEDFQLVYDYVVDIPMLRELRDIEKQAAQELGQWVEKQERDVTSNGKPVPIQIIEVIQPPTIRPE